MKYEQFEQLPVWQAAIDLAVAVYAFTKTPAIRGRHSLRDQPERAAASVSNTIAEGFERGTKQELFTFHYIARGSAGEVLSMLCLLEKISAFANLESRILGLKSSAEGVARQLGAWLLRLRDSDFKGERFVNEKMRRAEQVSRERREFLEEFARVRQGAPFRGGSGIPDSKFKREVLNPEP